MTANTGIDRVSFLPDRPLWASVGWGFNGIAPWNWSAYPSLCGASSKAVVRRVRTVGELDDALAACASPSGTVSFIEVVLDRYDMPPAIREFIKRFAAQNA